MNKNTGELVWEDNSVDDRILHGQWSSAAVGSIGGVTQVVMGQGDGWVRSYVAATGEKLWEFDTNPADATWPKTRNNVISTPVLYNDRGLHRERPGPGARRRRGSHVRYRRHQTRRYHSDRSSLALRWDPALDFHRGDSRGHHLHARLQRISARSRSGDGEPHWVHDTFAAVWASPLIADGRLYLGDEDGDVVVLKPGKEEVVIAETNLGSSVYSTAVPANGVLFLASRNQLFALQQ